GHDRHEVGGAIERHPTNLLIEGQGHSQSERRLRGDRADDEIEAIDDHLLKKWLRRELRVVRDTNEAGRLKKIPARETEAESGQDGKSREDKNEHEIRHE